MKSIIWLPAILLLAATLLSAQAVSAQDTPPKSSTPSPPTRPPNVSAASLLQGAVGETPKGWQVSTEGYSGLLTPEGAKPGRRSVLLQREPGVIAKSSFGNMMRTFSALPYRGKKLRFRATVRFDRGQKNQSILMNNQAHLWMRVDRTSNAGPSFFDNMENHPITASAWRSYEIIGPVGEDSETVTIGLLLIGLGRTWMNTATIEVFDGKKWKPIPEANLTLNAPPSGAETDPKTVKTPPGTPPIQPSSPQTKAPTVMKESAALQGAVGATPKGWFVPTAGYSALIVAEGAKAGQHSVLLQKEANAPGKTGFGNIMRTFNGQPFRGKKMRFRAMARFAGMGADNQARLWMRVDRAHNAGPGFFENLGDHPVIADAWKPFEITGQVDADAEYINVGFMLLGDGKAWLGDVAIEVFDGKNWTLVPAELLTMNNASAFKKLDPKREQALVAQLKEHAVPLTTVEAGHGFDDLAPLDKIVGDARIVALGEASHGTREFFQMKHRILEYLVNKKGFTVFAIEANWPESEVVDRYIKTGVGDITASLDAMYFWTWHTQEVADMIQWMRDYNKRPGDHPTLTFTSFDMQTPDVAAQQVLDYVSKADKADLDTVQKAYAHFLPGHQEERRNGTPEMLTAGQAWATQVTRLLEEKWISLIKASSEADFLHARQCARIVQQAATMEVPGQNSYAVRDRSMAENVQWLAKEAYPKQKIVLWAHNAHVGDGAIVGAASMGHHLRQMFGTQMVTFGFGFDFGEIRAVTMTDSKMTTGPVPQKVPAAMPGTAEALLVQAGAPRYLLDFRAIPPTSMLGVWLAEDQLFREPGAGYSPAEPEAMFSPVALRKTFDGLIFIRESHASVLLPSGRAPKK